MGTRRTRVGGRDRQRADRPDGLGAARADRTARVRDGRRFDEARLADILALANEQQEWSRRTRDLLAQTSPAPIDIVDSIPAVMIPQWHRGTAWGRDAAQRFHEEVEAAVGRGDAVCQDERLRLMWVGRGLWFNLGFYQHFQERYGAVFVWSMYLAIAADGYPRYGGEPLRQLAARFAAFTDFLGLPGWADQWYLEQARTHRVDGVVHLVAHDSRDSYFTTKALEDAGIPVPRDRRRQRRRAHVGRGRLRRLARALHRGTCSH